MFKSPLYTILFCSTLLIAQVPQKDLLGKDFQSVKNFIIKLETIADRFLSQVVANRKS
ncbi:hypothetical protein JHD50_00515 [Sulfurimonas sp. MAG313]|nr:hypothetical protein [Sulfurimonas sp. MAG313]MDF1879796.1 hypothetical protein [Sulfurimonas sp. MAG313]